MSQKLSQFNSFSQYIDVCMAILQVEPATQELVEGYGVIITKKQLVAAESKFGSSATKLIRNLVSCFFTPEVLSVSTAYGSRGGRSGLDKDVLSACIHKVIQKHACNVVHMTQLVYIIYIL